jgi:hypothetical protein
MNRQPVAFQSRPPSESIYVSWTEQWDVPRYVDHYLRERKLAVNAELRGAVSRRIAKFPSLGVRKKCDLDYYLDSNACEFIEIRSSKPS